MSERAPALRAVEEAQGEADAWEDDSLGAESRRFLDKHNSERLCFEEALRGREANAGERAEREEARGTQTSGWIKLGAPLFPRLQVEGREGRGGGEALMLYIKQGTGGKASVVGGKLCPE